MHIYRADYEIISDGVDSDRICDYDGQEEEIRSCEPDEFDREDGVTAVDIALSILSDEGPYLEPDVMPGRPSWFIGHAEETPDTGVEWTFVLEGFTLTERDEIGRRF